LSFNSHQGQEIPAACRQH